MALGDGQLTVTLRIAGWHAEGLRCPDHRVSFEIGRSNTVHPVSLVQMPNGTGKTTTLSLLRYVLSGARQPQEWSPAEVSSWKKRTGGERHGRFQVVLFLNERRVTFTMDFNFDAGTVACATTLPSGQKKGFHPPRMVERLLRPEFVSFFIFDGELAEHLIDPRHTDAEKVIDGLFQLYTFDRLKAHIGDHWNSATKNAGAKEAKGLSRRRNRVIELERLIRKRERQEAKHTREYNSVCDQYAEQQRTFRDALKQQRTRQRHVELLKDVEAELRDAIAGKNDTIAQLVGLMKDPCAFSPSVLFQLAKFRRSLDQAKLPESAAREFFVELAEQDVCVCGRTLDADSQKAILDRAERYLGSRDVALLNEMKSEVGRATNRDTDSHSKMAELISTLKFDTRLVSDARTRRDVVSLDAARGDDDLEAVNDQIGRLRVRKEELEARLYDYQEAADEGRDPEIVSIPVLKRRLTNAEHKLAEITKTLDLKRRRDLLLEMLSAAQHQARSLLRDTIRDQSNDRISALMPDNRICVERIDKCLHLRGQTAGSTGENLSVAYAFLATLFHRAQHKLPFVVDSPANPIDLKVRAKVATLIPKLTDQFIAFTISSERVGFLDSLEAAAQGHVQHLTLFRKGNRELDALARAEETHEESVDGIVVDGATFFKEFQLDSEE